MCDHESSCLRVTDAVARLHAALRSHQRSAQQTPHRSRATRGSRAAQHATDDPRRLPRPAGLSPTTSTPRIAGLVRACLKCGQSALRRIRGTYTAHHPDDRGHRYLNATIGTRNVVIGTLNTIMGTLNATIGTLKTIIAAHTTLMIAVAAPLQDSGATSSRPSGEIPPLTKHNIHTLIRVLHTPNRLSVPLVALSMPSCARCKPRAVMKCYCHGPCRIILSSVAIIGATPTRPSGESPSRSQYALLHGTGMRAVKARHARSMPYYTVLACER